MSEKMGLNSESPYCSTSSGWRSMWATQDLHCEGDSSIIYTSPLFHGDDLSRHIDNTLNECSATFPTGSLPHSELVPIAPVQIYDLTI